ncbi:P13 family porin (plasmid) [Borrelia miyamotoi]|uniref:P13 family porin n=1 Tax=Borrelia miyamotoi TaxID=47466 RepID=A0A481YJ95_9SPIR|nr:P13 family porin [Borrelia miyamotoi]ATQ16646.1 P13 family porin [Borrelia miyamotoi]QBK63821.1 P13 family porin [Borrelia miyamotoi]QBK65239.1 P13 family porin [Borrelia miyamotoi]WEG99909.1 P13 family porin [Borrelia miyamotoi]
MKQILSLILFFICIVVSFAQNYEEISSDTVVTKGSGDNNKMLLYEVSKKGILAPFLLNFFFGFGIGSFVQGDVTGGLIVLASEIFGLGLIGTGMGFMSSPHSSMLGISLASVGGIVVFATRIAEIIIPFTHAYSYNRKLQEKLGVSLGGFNPQFELNLNKNAGLEFEIAFIKKF